MAKEFNENIRGFGCSFGYTMIVEGDITAPAGLAYTPPERGDFRRINLARTIQLLQDSSGVVETFQLSDATIRLPSNQLGDDNAGNDAGNGRSYYFKNSGSGKIFIQKNDGTLIATVYNGVNVSLISNQNNQWDVYFKAENIGYNYDYIRRFTVEGALNELADNDSSRGYSEATYTGVFVYSITTYTDTSKTKILDKTIFNYTGAFITTFVKDYYDFDTGTIPEVRMSGFITYNVNRSVHSVEIIMSRLV